MFNIPQWNRTVTTKQSAPGRVTISHRSLFLEWKTPSSLERAVQVSRSTRDLCCLRRPALIIRGTDSTQVLVRNSVKGQTLASTQALVLIQGGTPTEAPRRQPSSFSPIDRSSLGWRIRTVDLPFHRYRQPGPVDLVCNVQRQKIQLTCNVRRTDSLRRLGHRWFLTLRTTRPTKLLLSLLVRLHLSHNHKTRRPGLGRSIDHSRLIIKVTT